MTVGHLRTTDNSAMWLELMGLALISGLLILCWAAEDGADEMMVLVGGIGITLTVFLACTLSKQGQLLQVLMALMMVVVTAIYGASDIETKKKQKIIHIMLSWQLIA